MHVTPANVRERRRQILLAAVVQHRPKTLDELRRCPQCVLWTRQAFDDTVDAAVIDGVLISAGGPNDPLIAITDRGWSL